MMTSKMTFSTNTWLRTQTFYFYSLDTGDDESGDGDDGDDDEQQNGKR